MNKLKWLIYIVALGIFGWYEYQLGLKFLEEHRIREAQKAQNTEKIKNNFLLREPKFYLDGSYKKKLKELKKNELEEQIGGDLLGNVEDL